ncbi:VOC family protein [Cohaesibacter gelatinilyticus]|uniref:VOC family protein n=1 Tax=Cohaesibacter gelatinilyticus TaxID=372072 RepID=UPI003CC804C2
MNEQEQRAMTNPVFYFEIPVIDMDRAVAFYESVFGFNLKRKVVDGYEMALFPRADGKAGASQRGLGEGRCLYAVSCRMHHLF